jgi:chromate reductase, NAD(P)H dehydrogenase (quinone)
MSSAPTILAFSSSTRADSLNKKLIAIAVAGARAAGGTVDLIDLRDFPLPLYDGDLEAAEGLPRHAVTLKKLFADHRGLLVSTAEYNGSVTGVVKNAIDWVSRSATGQPSLESFTGKIAALVSAGLGPVGGFRSQAHLRQILGTVNVILLPNQWRIPNATAAHFDEAGNLKDATAQKMTQEVGAALARFLQRLAD